MADINLKLPDLKCDKFSGEGTNELQYHAFITKFNNVVGYRANLSDATKLTYLKTYLQGYAAKIVQHLQISNANYKIALELLTREFLDINALVDDLLTKLFELKPRTGAFTDIKLYINEVRCILGDLSIYDYDIVATKCSNKMISHLVFHKLPADFKQELVRKLANNFPSIEDIFNNYVEVIRTLNLQGKCGPDSKVANNSVTVNNISKAAAVNTSLTSSTSSRNKLDQSSYKDNSKSVIKPKYCKFCCATGHTMLHCRKYATHEARIKRCNDLKMCKNCSSQRHFSGKCNSRLDFACSFCQTLTHISALCPKYCNKLNTNFCLNSAGDAGKTFVLPSIRLKVGHGKQASFVNFLLDTGSQRSYVSQSVMERLKVQNYNGNNIELFVSTFLESVMKEFSETSLSVNLTGRSNPVAIPFLISEDVNLSYTIEGLTDALTNIRSRFPDCAIGGESDEVQLEGLLGVDAIQCFYCFQRVSCLGGSIFKVGDHIVPYGNVDNFLTDKQLSVKYSSVGEQKSVDGSADVDKAIVNFILNPIKSYFDPIGSVIDDSSVEHNLDKMFSVESLGLTEESCDYDEDQITRFNAGISFSNNTYSVAIPWNDKINQVPHNFGICKAVLSRVVTSLKQRNLYEDYNAVIQQQLDEDILEPIALDESNLDSHVFIPHRPVIKTNDQVTTKLRIVLNCSLKIGSYPSLNQAAYPGINLLTNLLDLLIKIRSNDFLVSSDVKQAFLMIKIAKDVDK